MCTFPEKKERKKKYIKVLLGAQKLIYFVCVSLIVGQP